MADTTFSLEIGEKFTRIADGRVNGNKIEVSYIGASETAPLFFTGEDEKTVEQQAVIINKLYSNSKIRKKNVNVIIPDSFTFSQILDMPKLREKELLSAIRYQADEFIPMPIEETSLDLEIIQEKPKEKKLLILIVASPKKIVGRVERVIETAGLNPEILENEFTATARLASSLLRNTLPEKNATVIVNLGYTSTSFYLIDNATLLALLSRNVKIGFELFIKDLMANITVDEKKALEVLKLIGLTKNASYNFESLLTPVVRELTSQIEKFITSSKERYNINIDQILLCGHGQMVQYLDQKIQSFLTTPTTFFPLSPLLVENPIAKSIFADSSAYLPVIAGTI